MNKKEYDLIVIGAGSGGLGVALGMHQLGFRVLLVDRKAENIVIATGSSPRTIAIPGAESFPVFTNESIFDINFIPKHFVFIGAGPVSIELGRNRHQRR